MPRAWTLVVAFAVLSSGLVALIPASEAAALTSESVVLPKELVGASAAYFGGKTYVFGGRDPTGAYSDTVYALDHASRAVSLATTLPDQTTEQLRRVNGGPGRYSGTAAVVEAKIYYFGGATLTENDVNGDGTPEQIPKASADVIEFDPATKIARMLPDKLPVGAWGMASAATNSRYVYLFGGFTFDVTDLGSTGRHDRILKFDAAAPEPAPGSSARFRTLDTELPYAVQDAAAAQVGSRRIYIMGGLSDHNNDTNPCPTYTLDGQTRQITVCQSKRMVSFDPDNDLALGVAGELPYRAQFISAAVVAQKAYVSGALLPDQTPSASVVEVSLDRNGAPQTRVIVPSLPRGAFGQAVASDGQNILLIGGRYGAEKELSNAIIRLDPRPTAPWPPRAATSAEIAGSGVRLSWEAPSYNGDSPVTGYRIYRLSAGGAEERIGETAALSYDDVSVRPGTEYTWRVSAVNSAGEGAAGARVTRSSGVATPGTVASFEVYAGNALVQLRWLPPNETGGSNITGYRILRDDVLLASAAPDATEYVDRTVKNNEAYVYQIRAFNAKGDGASSAILRARPALVPDAPTNLVTDVLANGETSSVRLSWFPSQNAASYSVYRSSRAGTLGSLVQNVSATSVTDAAVERGQTYYYTVVASNEQGTSPPSAPSSVSLVRKPGPPTQIVALGQEGEIRVAWQPPQDTGDAPAGLLRYYVSRSAGGATSIVKTDIENHLYVDRLVTPGINYTYTVTTLNPMSSDASVSVSAAARALLNKFPVAILAAIPGVTAVGDPVELDASSSADLDGTIRSYLYDFGDGTEPVTTPKASVSHQYALNGTYNATVIITDDRGAKSLAYAQILVGEIVSGDNEPPETGVGTPPGRASPTDAARPGSESPGIPGPGLLLVALALGAAAFVARRTGRNG